MLLILAAAFGTARAQSFSLPIPRNVGFNPNSAAVGDFNADGKLDVAVGNTLGGSVTIALGNGDGTFVSSIEYNTDLNPEGVAVGDFNKDGKLDVAVANFRGGPTSSGNISVLFGNGDGTMQAAVNYDAPGGPMRLVVADLNSDGNLDLVTASNTTNKVTVLLGNANGTFNAAAGYTVGTHPQDVAVADFNKDGKLDLATPNSGASVSVLLGNGDGTFQAATNLPQSSPLDGPFSITAGDLNGDGNPDLVFSSSGGAVGVLLGKGDGTFQPAVSYATTGSPATARLGDFNGDAKLDVAVVNSGSSGSVGVLRGKGDGTLQAVVNFPTQSSPWGLVVADLNKDGKPDVITTNNSIGRINVLLNSPSARGADFNATATLPVNGVTVASFTDYDTTKTAASFTATINWGDAAAPSAGTVADNGSGGFNVTGSHTYASAGSYAVSVQIADTDENFANASATATVAKQDQTITFGALSNKTFGDQPFTVSATATSGLAVSFSASGNCTSGGTNGSTITINGAGSCTVTASQAGDTNFNAAPNVAQSFQIARASQTITFGALTDLTFGSLDFGVDATGGASGNPVTFSAQGNCTIVNKNNINLVHLTGAGSCSVTASQAGDSNFNAAPDVTQSFTIFKSSVIIFLSASPNPSIAGQEVTLGAFIQIDRSSFSSPAAVPGGSVQFQVDGKDVGGPVACGQSNGARNSCSASITTSTLAAGSHSLRVNYSGDANFLSSTSAIGLAVQSGVEFTQATYTVAERDGSASITVRRVGDTASAASVDYATDDGSTPSVAVPCSSVTGLALERCDYTRAAGTLHFAPGEAQKTFTVLVNDDSYAEGTETLSLRLSNPVGFVLGPQSSATLQITDDTQQTTSPIDGSSFFVRQHYHDFLNREPDDAGLQFWTNGIESCGADAQCREVKRINTSAAFFLSIEFQETGYLVERIYKTAFGDADGSSNFPSQHTLKVPVVRLNEFLLDTQRIGQGVVVGQGDWQTQLENNKQAFVLDFASRQPFTNLFPAAMTADEFVSKLDQNAGGVLTAEQKAQLASSMGATPADPSKRANVLRQVAENPVLAANEKNRAFVLMQFFGYLRRNPNDAQDTDYTGYDFWLQKLNQFNGDFVRAEMVKAFITSIEYRQRFGQ
ncbi:MAG: FG-GAP-like repeat-containing protein [Acidobacteriota bacterium]|nr:FG-GAP-like repeat-containing protein [Acidobacteriota bacterium]